MPQRKVHPAEPPLREYEMPDTPSTRLDIPREHDTFVVPGEDMTKDERRTMPSPVILPPLHPSECPESVARVFAAEPDPRLDGPEWGTAKRAPDIMPGKTKLLRPWDD